MGLQREILRVDALRWRCETDLKALEEGLCPFKIGVARDQLCEIGAMARNSEMDELVEDHAIQYISRCAREALRDPDRPINGCAASPTPLHTPPGNCRRALMELREVGG